MPTITLSEAATALLHRRLAGERVEVTEETRPAYRELVDAGLMIPVHSFRDGREARYALTTLGCKMSVVLDRITAPSPAESAAPRP